LQVIELKLHHHDPPNSEIGLFFANYAKEIEQKTNGKVKITVYPGAALGGAKEAYNMVTSGVCDMAWGFVGLHPGQFPLTEAIDLPMLGVKDAYVGSMALWELYNTTDYLKKEYKDVEVLLLHTHLDVPIGLKSKKVETADDIKGMKIRTPGGPPLDFLRQLGASPITMPPNDLYQSLEKGVIDGYMIDWQGVYAFRLPEQSKYLLDAKVYVAPFWIVMNKAKWASLPPDVQKVIKEVSGEAAIKKLDVGYNKSKKFVEDEMAKRKAAIYTLSASEQQRWETIARGVWDKWVADMTAKGLPAKETLVKLQELIKKYNNEKR